MQTSVSRQEEFPVVDYLALELTNKCNLECIHCYAESGPHVSGEGGLSRQDYERLLKESAEMGCRTVQFIGGEPTLNQDLIPLIQYASDSGFEFIEVFTNLTRLSPELMDCFTRYNVHVATSVYADNPALHDQITQRTGSFGRTIRNIKKLLQAGIDLRAGIIEMEANEAHVELTRNFLLDLGVKNIGGDKVRGFGRGQEEQQECELGELCGSCAGNMLCVGPDGEVSPCIMSKNWAVGSAANQSLIDIAGSEALSELRQDIYRTVVEPREKLAAEQSGCDPHNCGPYIPPPDNCYPCAPNGIHAICDPKGNCSPDVIQCSPTQGGCTPCYPKG